MKIKFLKLQNTFEYHNENGVLSAVESTTYRTVKKVKRPVIGLDYGYCQNDATGGWRVGYCDEFTKNREWAWQVSSKAAAVDMISKNMGGV
jgi:hypothetical protein